MLRDDGASPSELKKSTKTTPSENLTRTEKSADIDFVTDCFHMQFIEATLGRRAKGVVKIKVVTKAITAPVNTMICKFKTQIEFIFKNSTTSDLTTPFARWEWGERLIRLLIIDLARTGLIQFRPRAFNLNSANFFRISVYFSNFINHDMRSKSKVGNSRKGQLPYRMDSDRLCSPFLSCKTNSIKHQSQTGHSICPI